MSDTPNYVQVGKLVARFVEPPSASLVGESEGHALRRWCNRVEDAALRLLDENPDSAGLVVCTREYFDELRKKGA